ncbi:hypothetical protein PFICI_10631 [Pestalotiopsis fici W106-1]|uniref:Uncharacterized protein n=1 Tax=Pestalotiopsis fici (strain W106-1 / CGMCC3.15140) TaxID=1229662 RepID=W3WXQ1_PESFW|nr:uncharacterized protein PFICI_10631 [Pestalotiopsis fici W106-1]ETS78569.1 hypothetical protein PFICI_10631 [Pestalotiopsis fici W106-1]
MSKPSDSTAAPSSRASSSTQNGRADSTNASGTGAGSATEWHPMSPQPNSRPNLDDRRQLSSISICMGHRPHTMFPNPPSTGRPIVPRLPKVLMGNTAVVWPDPWPVEQRGDAEDTRAAHHGKNGTDGTPPQRKKE